MIASAWVILHAMGQNGYMALADKTMKTTIKIREAVEKHIVDLKILAPSDMTCLAIASNNVNINILAIADAMDELGWKMERQQLPNSLHLSVMPHHEHVVDQLINDLKKSVAVVLANPALNNTGTTGMYGLVASIPDKTIVQDFIVKFFSALYTADSQEKRIIEVYDTVMEVI